MIIILKRQLIMNIGKTVNNFGITREMVLNSIESFDKKPIVYNKKQDLIENNFDNYENQIVIGMIKGNIEVTDTEVFADISLLDRFRYLWKGRYDNWCINYPVNDDKNKFDFLSVEVF